MIRPQRLELVAFSLWRATAEARDWIRRGEPRRANFALQTIRQIQSTAGPDSLRRSADSAVQSLEREVDLRFPMRRADSAVELGPTG